VFEREFNITNDWDFDVFGSVIFGVTGFSTGAFGKFFIELFDEASFPFVWNVNFSADTVFNLVESN
jgi:hypothetical protein